MFYNKTKRRSKFNIFKLFFLCILFALLGFSFNLYSNMNYSTVTNEFYTSFNNYEFDKAKNIIDSKRKYLLFKKGLLSKDLTTYFTDVVNKVCTSIKEDKINDNQALTILTEIKKYNVLNSSLDKLIESFNTSNTGYVENTEQNGSNLDLGIKSLNSKKYSNALDYFNSIPKNLKDDYAKAQEYIKKCKILYKEDLLKQADELIANKYYTKAIDLLSSYDKKILSSNDKDISGKINSTKMFKEEYLANLQGEDSEYTSNAILDTITPKNINTLNIESKTPYFIYLNIKEQKTYIYNGSKNNWNLEKTLSCSTGLPGKETPKGVFAITGRGEWFFSEEFMQGGKYWVQFMGDYLFHSLPFDETQSKVLDDTLGTPASHGCIRLEVEDSKWIYDNVGNNTKIIIN
ncbi:hypothetical protein JCM1393_11770 [Clostridium carnis]